MSFEFFLKKILVLLSLAVPIVACTNKNQEIQSDVVKLVIHGELRESTLQEFKEAIESIENKEQKLLLNAIQLNSNGGSGNVAREIGKIIRGKRLNTYLSEDSKCESACVFILIGGVQRYAFGKVGVHRTTYMDTPNDDENVAEDISESVSEVSEYIKSMGVSVMLDDAINTTESWKMRYLTETEKRQWQVFGIDRLEEELYFNKLSRERGISRKDFVEIFKYNYEKCLNETKELKETIFECVNNKKSRSVGFLEDIIFKVKNLF